MTCEGGSRTAIGYRYRAGESCKRVIRWLQENPTPVYRFYDGLFQCVNAKVSVVLIPSAL